MSLPNTNPSFVFIENDVSKFVDLSTTLMGDDAMSMTKAKCLLNAVNGFSALIYELETNSDYSTFISCCEKVWEASRQNKRSSDRFGKELIATAITSC